MYESVTLYPSSWNAARMLEEIPADENGHRWRELGTPIPGCLGSVVSGDTFVHSCLTCMMRRATGIGPNRYYSLDGSLVDFVPCQSPVPTPSRVGWFARLASRLT